MNIFIVLLPIMGGYFITYMGYHLTFIIVTVVMFTAFFILGKQRID